MSVLRNDDKEKEVPDAGLRWPRCGREYVAHQPGGQNCEHRVSEKWKRGVLHEQHARLVPHCAPSFGDLPQRRERTSDASHRAEFEDEGVLAVCCNLRCFGSVLVGEADYRYVVDVFITCVSQGFRIGATSANPGFGSVTISINTVNEHFDINAFGLMADPEFRPRLRQLAHALLTARTLFMEFRGGGDGPAVAAWSGDLLPHPRWPALHDPFSKSPDATSITVPSSSAAKVSCIRRVFLDL